MRAIADTDRLVADGIIDAHQAQEIERRARREMVALGVNCILCLGILAATGGLIFWLADPLAVAIWGLLSLAGGAAILWRGGDLFAMFGHAMALIGAGMLVGGACVELVQNHAAIAAVFMLLGGATLLLASGVLLLRPLARGRFVLGAIFLMGLAVHLSGTALWLEEHEIAGASRVVFYFYAAVAIAGAGWLVDVRLVTALAIVPFAQMLDTGTGYFHAAYVFFSPEPTLSILQMCLLIAMMLTVARQSDARTARHAMVLVMLAFVVANLCALVGALWGDVVGETVLGPHWQDFDGEGGYNATAYEAAREAFRDRAVTISADLYAILWAIALAATLVWAALGSRRGLFNAALTFAAIHFYTQLFESFGDEPLAWVIGGLAAVPLAWGMWRLDAWIARRAGEMKDNVG
ncbi:hypothetical protein R3X27_19775 [Tropicimonas sp. TH_r6]|uniref:hypothetical protein n=1 Tax=Tropicimonas sp. TH_r6 TaxID=3082085 RepID=UPI0029546440|nr:hypothetical protein [Tropicimonas sp. TH_r6]MDV7144926.1 hypothetical protein [Tropicimonas sp. TH_r6]